MRTRTRLARLLAVTPIVAVVGCHSVTGVRTGAPPQIRTITSIGDKPQAVVAGAPGESVTTRPGGAHIRDETDGQISGRVVDERGRAIPGATVRVAVGGAATGRAIQAACDNAGRFTLHGLRPDTTYRLIAEDERGELLGRASASTQDSQVRITLRADADDASPRRVERASERQRPGDDPELIEPRVNAEDLPGPSETASTRESLEDRISEDPRRPASPWRKEGTSPPGQVDDLGEAEPLSGTTGRSVRPVSMPPTGAIEEIAEPAPPVVPRRRRDPDDERPAPPAHDYKPGAIAPAAPEVRTSAEIPASEPIRPTETKPLEPAPVAASNSVSIPFEPPPDTTPVAAPQSTSDPLPTPNLSPTPDSSPIPDPLPSAVPAPSEPATPSPTPAPTPAEPAPATPVDPLPINPPADPPVTPPADPPTALPTEPPAEGATPANPPVADPKDAPVVPATEPVPSSAPPAADLLPAPAETVAPEPATPTPDTKQASAPAPKRPTWGELASRRPPSMAIAAGDSRNRHFVAPYREPERKGERPRLGPDEAQPGVVKAACQFDGKTQRLVDFRLPDLQGQPIQLSEMDADLVLLDFWGTWCGPCVETVPHLVQLQKRYGSKLRVVGIAYEEGNIAERAAVVEQAARKLGINYTVLLGGADGLPCPLQNALHIQAYPTLILVDRSGRILWRDSGSSSRMLARLDRVIASRTGDAAIVRR